MLYSTEILDIQLHKKLYGYNIPQWQTAGWVISGILSNESERAKSFGMKQVCENFRKTAQRLND